MTKKEYITLFLDKVKDVREPARGFVILMRYEILNDQQMQDLFELFKSVVQTSTDSQKKFQLQKAISAIEQLKHKEKSYESVQFNQDLNQILSEI